MFSYGNGVCLIDRICRHRNDWFHVYTWRDSEAEIGVRWWWCKYNNAELL